MKVYFVQIIVLSNI